MEVRLDISPLGDNPLNIFLRRRRVHVEQQRLVANVVREAGVEAPKPGNATAAGDARKLRGIPAIGPGVSGATPECRPGFKLFRDAADEA